MKLHKRTRINYWSNAKVFSWMLPEESKQPFTFEKLREQMAAGINPRPATERVIDTLQDTVMFPLDLIHSIRIYFKNSKGNTHVLDGGLDKGQWYDLTYRIPQCLFYELEKFIEQEKGLDVLEWEKGLVFDEVWGVKSDHPKWGTFTPQALSAIEQELIYLWWKANKDHDFDDENYMKEEEEMLIRLIKIRNSLWT